MTEDQPLSEDAYSEGLAAGQMSALTHVLSENMGQELRQMVTTASNMGLDDEQITKVVLSALASLQTSLATKMQAPQMVDDIYTLSQSYLQEEGANADSPAEDNH